MLKISSFLVASILVGTSKLYKMALQKKKRYRPKYYTKYSNVLHYFIFNIYNDNWKVKFYCISTELVDLDTYIIKHKAFSMEPPVTTQVN